MDSTSSNPPKRRYTVSQKVLAASRANQVRARANPNSPARRQARLRNLEKAWARQRDPKQIPGCPFIHGAYSKDLNRTAPLAGESEGEFDRLLDRLLETFLPPLPHLEAGVRQAGDRIWRVRRVLQSRVHRERLAFYQGLFEAAEAPGGLGVERVEGLAERLAQALDLGGEEAKREGRSLEAQQRRLRGAVEAWAKAMWEEFDQIRRESRLESRLEVEGESAGEAGPELRLEPRPGHQAGAPATAFRARRRLAAAGRGPACGSWNAWMAWLRWEFAQRSWKLPPDEGGERLHLWLVRAAVVGGANVTGQFSPELERAIVGLARYTWERLARARHDLSQVAQTFEYRMADAAEARVKPAAEPAGEPAGPEPAEALPRALWRQQQRSRWLKAEVVWRTRVELEMRSVAKPWLRLDANLLATCLALWNGAVRKAIQAVALAVASAVEAESAAQSGQPAPISSGPAPLNQSGPLNPSGESGQLNPSGESWPSEQSASRADEGQCGVVGPC